MNNRGFDLAMLAVFAVLAAAILLYFLPGYKQIEAKTRYSGFQGVVPESHAVRDGALEVTLKNTFAQPVMINAIRSKGSCTYGNATIPPLQTLNATCGEFDGNLSVSYEVGGMEIAVSGKIPQN